MCQFLYRNFRHKIVTWCFMGLFFLLLSFHRLSVVRWTKPWRRPCGTASRSPPPWRTTAWRPSSPSRNPPSPKCSWTRATSTTLTTRTKTRMNLSIPTSRTRRMSMREVDMTGQSASSSSASSSAQLKKTHHLPQASDATKTPNRDWTLYLELERSGIWTWISGIMGTFFLCEEEEEEEPNETRRLPFLCIQWEKTVEAIMFSSRLALLRWHTGGKLLREKKSDGMSGIFFSKERCCILGVEWTLLFSLFSFSRLSLFSRVFLYRFHRLTIPVT